ncbi:hypothetical protein PoB_002342700 [Plakobranchus ocellatus]|uniref:Uncharacterized protein n=1 Tax=Plakobranchus ocellatus TaxID=259542 RepID=A0AAV3ZQZ4_9GAST|nr:hypothetical protein PoB_002342700 [Plakobranchus ocellatus]
MPWSEEGLKPRDRLVVEKVYVDQKYCVRLCTLCIEVSQMNRVETYRGFLNGFLLYANLANNTLSNSGPKS